MKKEKLLFGLIIFLVVLNGIVLYRSEFSGHPGPPRPPHDQIIEETLGLDNDQKSVFEDLKHEHHRKMVELEHEFGQTLSSYFQQLTTVDSTRRDSLEARLGDLEREKAAITYRHFEDLRNLCHPDQKPKFDAFLPQLIRFVLPPPNPRRQDFPGPPPKD